MEGIDIGGTAVAQVSGRQLPNPHDMFHISH